jgi:hypothetical protein
MIHSYLIHLTLSFCSFTVFLLTFSTDDSDFLTIVTCCLCALIIVSALLVYGSFKVRIFVIEKKNNYSNCQFFTQNIRRYVVSWIFVVAIIVVVQLMVLFDVIHVVNTKSNEGSDKSFLYTALEVFCLGEFVSIIEKISSLHKEFQN